MQMRYCYLLVFCVLMVGGAACAPKISPEVTEKVSWQGEFKTLQADPEAYTDEFVLLGGKIIRTDNFQGHSEITVLQFPTDYANRPQTDRESGGRFLVRSDSFIDPEVYEPGKPVTVAGRVAGAEKRPIGGYEYNHPVIEAEDMWVWEPAKERSPRLHFGLGIGTTF
ncbi:MAG: Slp family lipoprotein [Desulfobacterales bacterium]